MMINKTKNLGQCLNMCPEEECRTRFHSKYRIHLLERNNIPLDSIRYSDCKFVKEYSRSAAGTNHASPALLRPPVVLFNTIKYLMSDVFLLEEHSYHIIYSFIFDRCWAIRQDITIQQLDDRTTCQTLEIIVLFLIYSSHICNNYSIEEFDPIINITHIQQCLTSVLFLQEYNNIDINHHGRFVAIYLLLNFGDETVLRYALEKKNFLLKCEDFKLAFDMNVAFLNCNYQKLLKLSNNLDTILLYVFSKNINSIKLKYIQILNYAYCFKQSLFPIKQLSKLLSMSPEDTVNLIESVELKLTEDAVIFNKQKLEFVKVPDLRFEDNLSKKQFLDKVLCINNAYN